MLTLKQLNKSNNIAELLDDQELAAIGQEVARGYEIDEASRAEWQQIVDQAMEIAKQVMKKKSFPWENASNIKYPLITQASIDYASRTLPEIIQNERVVKVRVEGKDLDGTKYARANRVSRYLSHMLTQSPDWEAGTDKLLQILPVLGTVFKKTYYNEVERRICSELCPPDRVVVNYNVQSLEAARRITHVVSLCTNDVIERQREGIFLDCEIDELRPSMGADVADADYMMDFLEQHCYLDLDGDKYKEPYIVTLHKESRKVLRIVSRFKNIEYARDKRVLKIEPEQYFTDFHFIRSPDGGFYSQGFGSLLLPINKAINTLINQLIDSGTLANTQGGFIGKGLRIKNGQLKFKMGQWQVLDCASGEDIGKNIFPWPTKEPSPTLFQLLGLLMQVGRDLSSTTDVLKGNQPAQNVASSTVAQLVEQGTKVFVAINKRVYASLKKEYQKVYYFCSQFANSEHYKTVLDDDLADLKTDFKQDDLDVIPVADPNITTENQKIVRAGMVQQLRTADPREADRMFLEALQVDGEVIDKLLPPPDPEAPPAPEQMKLMAEVERLQAEVAKIAAEAKLAAEQNMMQQMRLQQDLRESEARVEEAAARVWKMQQDAMNNMRKMEVVTTKMLSEQELKAMRLEHEKEINEANTLVKIKETELKTKGEDSAKD